MNEVWVAEIWSAHGYDQYVLGVYDSRESAFEALRGLENMTAWADGDGPVHARPRREYPPLQRPPEVPVRWGHARPYMVQGRVA